jgi:glycosyltransferase involved in cell wall biosynthesis
MNTLSVIIPSRKQEKQELFIRRAIKSVEDQTIADQFNISYLIGVDKDCALEGKFLDDIGAQCIQSAGASQALALNAAIKKVQSEYVAFLEDDDQWMPEYLYFAMAGIQQCQFISSTQSEFDENDVFLRINDFPTPSGWFMNSSTLREMSGFNEDYRFHLDNEWLGRSAEKKITRLHLVESTAPIQDYLIGQVRPWLWKVLSLSGGLCNLGRHTSPYPLIKRLVHSKSGMAQISSNPELSKASNLECEMLVNSFGRIPW